MDSRFCKTCGSAFSCQVSVPVHIKDSSVGVDKCSVSEDEFSVNERLIYLDKLIDNSAYNKKKGALENEYLKFLGCSSSVDFLLSFSEYICKFLISKDFNGRTQVHTFKCSFSGKSGLFDCGCPKRLGTGTIQSLVGQLSALFELKLKGKTYDEARQQGNPACSLKVKKCLKAIEQDHTLARTQPPLPPQKKQANQSFSINYKR